MPGWQTRTPPPPPPPPPPTKKTQKSCVNVVPRHNDPDCFVSHLWPIVKIVWKSVNKSVLTDAEDLQNVPNCFLCHSPPFSESPSGYRIDKNTKSTVRSCGYFYSKYFLKFETMLYGEKKRTACSKWFHHCLKHPKPFGYLDDLVPPETT